MEKYRGIKTRLQSFFQHLGAGKYALIAALIGIVVLLLPTKTQEVTAQEDTPTSSEVPQLTEEQRMEEILSGVAGAGRVQIMLTTECSGKTEYQIDTDVTKSGESEERREQTVFSGGDTPLIRSVYGPTYTGALVICDGAERAEVRLDLVRAVCKLTGLSSDKVLVLKMKH